MFSKQFICCGTRYLQTVIPSFKIKDVNLNISEFWSNYLKERSSSFKAYYSTNNGSTGNNSSESFHRVSETNSEDKIKLEKWIEMVRFEGGRAPNKISEKHFSELYAIDNEAQRLRYLNYLFKKEIAEINDQVRKKKIKLLKEEKFLKKASKPKEHIEYGLWKNSMFSKLTKQHFKSFSTNKLVNALKYGQPLVIDLDFYDHMEQREVSSLAEQLSISITQNRNSSDPFNLIFCNTNIECNKYQVFEKIMPNVSNSSYPMNVTSESYLDLFPKEKLVYLTPNAKQEMKTFDHNAIYIIGGLVDLRSEYPITLAKAKRENIQTMRLPLEKYHVFKGSKNLALHVIVNIMIDLQNAGNWRKALRNIPRRLIKTGNQHHLDAFDYTKRRKF